MQKIGVEQWRQVFELLDAVLEIPVEARDAWFESLGGEFAELKPVLRDLLSRQTTPESAGFLQALPRFTIMGSTRVSLDANAALPGNHVGPYKLIREIGRGGMGSVWLAERADGAFKRQVALKLPHVTWAGGLAERMARERDILAGLEHPHIARFYDAGADALGRPYMAMEYVEGKPIDVYCREHSLSLHACVALLLDVAKAVAHAHSRLVVHRDLKPNNILVSADGVVHLLDFGIATLLTGDSATESLLTQVEGRVLTPEFAAPEQILGQPVSTAADVYSLAVVAFVLLTGERPSATRTTARQKALQGDLDAILNMALKNDPAARYATAEAFAADLQRFLKNEPVIAQPDSRLYRLRKFARRHRVGLTVASIVAVSLITATGISLWQAQLASEQRNRALALLDRSEAITDFVSQMLTEIATPDQPITVDQLLQRSEGLVASVVTENPEHQAVILQALSSYYVSFGNAAKAEALLARALALTRTSQDDSLRAKLTCEHAFAQSLRSNVDAARNAILRVLADPSIEPEGAAECFRHLAYIAQNTNDAQGALRFAGQAREQLRRSARADPLFDAAILGDLGYAHAMNGDAAAAEQLYAESIRKFQAIGRSEHALANTIRNNWGMASAAAGDVRGALTQYDEALAIARKHAAGGDVPAYLIVNRALQLDNVGRYDEALREYASALAIGQRTDSPAVILASEIGKARIQLTRGDIDTAERTLAQVAALFDKGVPRDGPPGMNAKLLSARIAASRGQFETAVRSYSEIAQFWQSRQMGTAGPMGVVLRWRAEALLSQGNTGAALEDALTALEIGRKLRGRKAHSSLTGLAQSLLSQIYAARGDQARATAAARDAYAELSNALGTDSPETNKARALMVMTTTGK